MNPVYIRLALYVGAGFVASAGFGNFDAEAGTLTLNIEEISIAVATAIGAASAVFAVWGKK